MSLCKEQQNKDNVLHTNCQFIGFMIPSSLMTTPSTDICDMHIPNIAHRMLEILQLLYSRLIMSSLVSLDVS